MRAFASLVVFSTLVAISTANAAVRFAVGSDVSARSVALVALSDEAIITLTLEVFADPDGVTPVANAGIEIVSAAVAGAHDHGVVKAVVDNLDPLTTYYLRLTVQGASGNVVYPATPPLHSITTAARTQTLAPIGPLQLNELLRNVIYVPAALASLEPVLILAQPDSAAAPLSVFTDPAAATPAAFFDLNNVRDNAGTRLLLGEGAVLRFDALYGLPCAARDRQSTFARSPAITPVGQALAYQPTTNCFFADTLCDGVVNVLDFQFLLDSLDETAGNCGYSPQLDIVPDNVIDGLDRQMLIDRFGDSEPFQ